MPPWIPVLCACLVVLYVVVVLLYARIGQPDPPRGHAPSGDGVHLTLTPTEVDAANDRLSVELSFDKGSDYAAPDGLSATSDLEILVTSTHNRQLLSYTADQPTAPLGVDLRTTGLIEQWPFDVHRVDSLVLAYVPGADGTQLTPVPTDVRLDPRHMPGWTVSLEKSGESWSAQTPDGEIVVQGYTVTAQRSTSTVAFGIVLLALMVGMPVLSLSVAIITLRGRRRAEPAFLGWNAALLFATPTLRNFLPGQPPIGSWVDYLIVLWVITGLILALVISVVAWHRQGRPVHHDDGHGPDG